LQQQMMLILNKSEEQSYDITRKHGDVT